MWEPISPVRRTRPRRVSVFSVLPEDLNDELEYGETLLEEERKKKAQAAQSNDNTSLYDTKETEGNGRRKSGVIDHLLNLPERHRRASVSMTDNSKILLDFQRTPRKSASVHNSPRLVQPDILDHKPIAQAAGNIVELKSNIAELTTSHEKSILQRGDDILQDRDARLREKFEKMRKEKEEIQNELEKSEAERRQKEIESFTEKVVEDEEKKIQEKKLAFLQIAKARRLAIRAKQRVQQRLEDTTESLTTSYYRLREKARRAKERAEELLAIMVGALDEKYGSERSQVSERESEAESEEEKSQRQQQQRRSSLFFRMKKAVDPSARDRIAKEMREREAARAAFLAQEEARKERERLEQEEKEKQEIEEEAREEGERLEQLRLAEEEEERKRVEEEEEKERALQEQIDQEKARIADNAEVAVRENDEVNNDVLALEPSSTGEDDDEEEELITNSTSLRRVTREMTDDGSQTELVQSSNNSMEPHPPVVPPLKLPSRQADEDGSNNSRAVHPRVSVLLHHLNKSRESQGRTEKGEEEEKGNDEEVSPTRRRGSFARGLGYGISTINPTGAPGYVDPQKELFLLKAEEERKLRGVVNSMKSVAMGETALKDLRQRLGRGWTITGKGDIVPPPTKPVLFPDKTKRHQLDHRIPLAVSGALCLRGIRLLAALQSVLQPDRDAVSEFDGTTDMVWRVRKKALSSYLEGSLHYTDKKEYVNKAYLKESGVNQAPFLSSACPKRKEDTISDVLRGQHSRLPKRERVIMPVKCLEVAKEDVLTEVKGTMSARNTGSKDRAPFHRAQSLDASSFRLPSRGAEPPKGSQTERTVRRDDALSPLPLSFRLLERPQNASLPDLTAGISPRHSKEELESNVAEQWRQALSERNGHVDQDRLERHRSQSQLVIDSTKPGARNTSHRLLDRTDSSLLYSETDVPRSDPFSERRRQSVRHVSPTARDLSTGRKSWTLSLSSRQTLPSARTALGEPTRRLEGETAAEFRKRIAKERSEIWGNIGSLALSVSNDSKKAYTAGPTGVDLAVFVDLPERKTSEAFVGKSVRRNTSRLSLHNGEISPSSPPRQLAGTASSQRSPARQSRPAADAQDSALDRRPVAEPRPQKSVTRVELPTVSHKLFSDEKEPGKQKKGALGNPKKGVVSPRHSSVSPSCDRWSPVTNTSGNFFPFDTSDGIPMTPRY